MSNEDLAHQSHSRRRHRSVLEFNIVNRVYPGRLTSYNTIGEIRGTDKADEVIMLGGHLDSWHAATGATDNAIGCAIMMEAARILKTLGVKHAGRFASRVERRRTGTARSQATSRHFGL
jgi:Zn-dependent M28 family amino/carboxypeptidase